MIEISQRLELVEQIVSCTSCPLSQATMPVPFYGPTPAKIAVLAEAPGTREAVEGRPLIGPAGQKLREHLRQVGLDPEELAYCNAVSCYPNGTPTPTHIAACEQNKLDQLDLINPQWLLILGKVALNSFRPELSISKSRGRPFTVNGAVAFATYHPSAALRNGAYEKAMHEDLETFKAMVDDGNWINWIAETCIICPKELEWVTDDGSSWCEDHMPPDGHEWKKMLELEMAECRRHVGNA